VSLPSVFCGIDIESFDRVKKLYGRGAMPLGLFTDSENRWIRSHLSAAYAFTAKEAILKAFGSGWFNTEIDAHDIELGFDAHGIPRLVNFTGEAKRRRGDDESLLSLDFYRLGEGLLSVFTLLGPQCESMQTRIIALCRSSHQLHNLSTGEITPAHAVWDGECTNTRVLGHRVIQFAVQSLCRESGALNDLGYVGYDESGAPQWINSSKLDGSMFKVAGISVTHDRNYICGIVIGKYLH
jgi:phosphopantetheinyl transferase (holo-ACP synthase)